MKEQNISTEIPVPASEQVTRPGGPALWQKIIQTLGYIDEAMLLEKGIRPAMTTYQRPSSEKKNEELNHGMAETPNYL
jgi:hypothetical protein